MRLACLTLMKILQSYFESFLREFSKLRDYKFDEHEYMEQELRENMINCSTKEIPNARRLEDLRFLSMFTKTFKLLTLDTNIE